MTDKTNAKWDPAKDLDLPLRWRNARHVEVGGDLFHDAVPDEYIARVFAVMALTPEHTYQILTKRHGRMRSFLTNPPKNDDGEYERDAGWMPGAGAKWMVVEALEEIGRDADRRLNEDQWALVDWPAGRLEWPLPNVWLGVSVEDQQRADLRIPALLETPAAVRWISAEPLLGPVDAAEWLGPHCRAQADRPFLDWVVAGGESGPKARPMHPDWARGLRDQCQAAGVAFHFKQWGAYRWVSGDRYDAETRCWVDDGIVPQRVSKKLSGRELDGRTWDEYPTPRTAEVTV